MVTVINYADEKFKPYQKLQTQTAYYFGADKVVEYSPADIDKDFYAKNKFILDQPRGAGYWLWKPYIIKDALNKVAEGDYVFYADSGAFFINKIQYLIDAMNAEKVNIMIFGGDGNAPLERQWTKRDAFILMDCDEAKYTDSPHLGATFVIVKKCAESESFIEEWLKYSQDPRIITDIPNQLGKENYPEFRENRHDETILSLVAKKRNIPPFRTPTQFANVNQEKTPENISKRSPYPQIFYHHRRGIPLQRTMEDFLLIYGGQPRLRAGVRTAIFLLEEGMVKESYDILWRIYEKYRVGNDSAWKDIWQDMLEITSKHKEIGVPYAEIFQPLLCKMFVQTARRSLTLLQIPQFIAVARSIENKSIIPAEFQEALLQLVIAHIEQASKFKLPPYIATAQEIWEDYLSLNMPDTPLKRYALEKYGGGRQ